MMTRVVIASIAAVLMLVSGCGGGSSGSMGGGGSGGTTGGAGNTGGGGAGGAGGAPPGGQVPPDGFGLFPEMAYSGFDGTHSYVVPFATDMTGTLTWSTSDPTLATAVAVADNKVPPDLADPSTHWALLTAKKAGTATVKVSNGTMTQSATLTIAAYTADQYTAGQTRYMTAPTGVLACAACHAGAGGVDHSPTVLAFNPDSALVSAITTGAYPDGYKLRAPNHTFMLTDAEKAGIVAYVRSLPPKGF